jgi:hypothetical protein
MARTTTAREAQEATTSNTRALSGGHGWKRTLTFQILASRAGKEHSLLRPGLGITYFQVWCPGHQQNYFYLGKPDFTEKFQDKMQKCPQRTERPVHWTAQTIKLCNSIANFDSRILCWGSIRNLSSKQGIIAASGPHYTNI